MASSRKPGPLRLISRQQKATSIFGSAITPGPIGSSGKKNPVHYLELHNELLSWADGIDIGAFADSSADIKTESISSKFINAPWMSVAMGEIGQREFSGSKHNRRIIDYHSATSLHATTDETPWCSSYINWCLRQTGISGTNSASVNKWLKWGTPCASEAGAITIIHNPVTARKNKHVSGNHVGFLIQETSSHYWLLGGNQSDQVKISSYPKSKWSLKGYRWP